MAVNKASPIPPWASVKIEPKRAFKLSIFKGALPPEAIIPFKSIETIVF